MDDGMPPLWQSWIASLMEAHILRKWSCIPSCYPSVLEWQEMVAKIYTRRSSAASRELKWWEGSRPGRSKGFLSTSSSAVFLLPRMGTKWEGDWLTGTFLNLLSHGDLPSAKEHLLFLPCWGEQVKLLSVLYLLPAECSGRSCGLPGEWVNRIISSAPPHNCSAGMSHQEQGWESQQCLPGCSACAAPRGTQVSLCQSSCRAHYREKNTFVLFHGELVHGKSMQVFPLILGIPVCVHVYVLIKCDGQYFTQQCYIKLSLNLTAGWLYYMQIKKSLCILHKTLLWKMIPGVM